MCQNVLYLKSLFTTKVSRRFLDYYVFEKNNMVLNDKQYYTDLTNRKQNKNRKIATVEK